MEIKYNFLSHYYLYAKHWYKKSDNIIEDLRKIHSFTYELEIEHVNKFDVIRTLIDLTYKHIKNERDFSHFIHNIFYFNNESIFREFNISASLESLIKSCLSILSLAKISEIEDTICEPNENCLPIDK